MVQPLWKTVWWFLTKLNMILPSIQFSCSVVSDCLRPHGLQHSRLPCPSSTPGACSNSRPSNRWCHPTISSSVIPFSSCLQSFPTSGFFPMILPCVHARLTQSYPTLCNLMECNVSGSFVHGIFKTRILWWVSVPSSRGSSQLRDRTHFSYIYWHWHKSSLPLAPRGKSWSYHMIHQLHSLVFIQKN